MRTAVLLLVWAALALAGDPPGLVFVRVNDLGAEEWLRVRDGATVVRIPRGNYARRPYEGKIAKREPQPFFVESFFIDRTEVTNAQFVRFLNAVPDAARHVRPGVAGLERTKEGWRATPGRESHPVTGCTGHGAVAFAKWVGGAIPTTPQWEKAAGGAVGRLWPWGDAKPDATRANFGGKGGALPVGALKAGASPYGCLDMAGNVSERTVSDRVMTEHGPVVIKGGSWVTPHTLNLRVLDMCVQPMEVADRSVGFRCAMSDPDPERAGKKPAKAPVLRLAKSWDAAKKEAQKRRVPIFLSLQFDTCGQCDRTRAQLFRDPRFIAYCNAKMVVAIGHKPGDAVDDPHKEHEDGRCSLYAGLRCYEHHAVFNKAIRAVGRFQVSPGNFVCRNARSRSGAGPSRSTSPGSRRLAPRRPPSPPKASTSAAFHMKRILPLLFLLPTIALLVYARRARMAEEDAAPPPGKVPVDVTVEVVVDTGQFDFGEGVVIRVDGVQDDRAVSAEGMHVTFPVPGPAALWAWIERPGREGAPSGRASLGARHEFEVRGGAEPQRVVIGFTR
ncbi:MAG: SUMF1/EgtB/PvdO family nonheme iron enzyme, partial [Planctomycetota bacterium]